MLAEDIGSCHGNILRYRYDSEKRECVSFNYTGCGGNYNQFPSVEACDRACGRYRLQDVSVVRHIHWLKSNSFQVCSQGPSPGNCNLKVQKWHYDKESGRCKIFIWSGCGGNGNKFSSNEECTNLCERESRVSKNRIFDSRRLNTVRILFRGRLLLGKRFRTLPGRNHSMAFRSLNQ